MTISHSNPGSTSKVLASGKVVQYWKAYQWHIVIVIGLAALVLSFVGHWRYLQDQGVSPSILDVLYRTMLLFMLKASVETSPSPGLALQIARVLGPLAMALTAIPALVIVTLEWGQAGRLYFAKRHVVVCGIGRKGLQLVRDFRAKGKTVVAIDLVENNDHLRACHQLGAIVLIGDASQVDLLERARIVAASQVVATTGDDGVNVEIAVQAYRLSQVATSSPAGERRLQCLVHLVDLRLWSLFRQTTIFKSITPPVDVRSFNVYENCARQLFEEHPLDREHINQTSPFAVHLVVIGFGKMGQAVVLQAARIGHFANGKSVRMTIVDTRINELKDRFLALYPQFTQVCATEFIQMSAGGLEVNERLSRWAAEANSLLTMVVCLDNDSQSLTQALSLAEGLRPDIPILVRMKEETGLVSLLTCEKIRDDVARQIHAFGQIDQACALKRIQSDCQDRIARQIHENYLAQAQNDSNKKSDCQALLPWKQLPEGYKNANRQIADHVDVKLRAVKLPVGKPPVRGFTDAEIETLSRMEHVRWMAERRLAGWRYAPPPNESSKTNPNLVPWERLDDGNKEKDRQVVRNLRLWLVESSSTIRTT